MRPLALLATILLVVGAARDHAAAATTGTRTGARDARAIWAHGALKRGAGGRVVPRAATSRLQSRLVASAHRALVAESFHARNQIHADAVAHESSVLAVRAAGLRDWESSRKTTIAPPLGAER